MDGRQTVALLIKAPGLAAGGAERATQKVALVAAAASTQQDCFAAIGVTTPQFLSVTDNGRYVRVQCTQDFTIAFGPTGMGAPVIGTEWPLLANTIYEFWVDPTETRYFRAISAANATLFWYLG